MPRNRKLSSKCHVFVVFPLSRHFPYSRDFVILSLKLYCPDDPPRPRLGPSEGNDDDGDGGFKGANGEVSK